jgi:hypothetical protein
LLALFTDGAAPSSSSVFAYKNVEGHHIFFLLYNKSRVVDPYSDFNPDPDTDPAIYLNIDPDPSTKSVNPDPIRWDLDSQTGSESTNSIYYCKIMRDNLK